MTKPTEALQVEVNAYFGDDPYSPTTAVDITSHVLDWSVDRGVATPLQPIAPGRLQFTLDDSVGAGAGNYDPGNTGGTYTGDLRENLYVTLDVVPVVTNTSLIRAFVDTWNLDPQYPALTEVQVTASDLLKMFGLFVGGASYPAQTTSERIDTVLDRIGVPDNATWRELDAGLMPLAAIPSGTQTNALAEMQRAATAEAPWAAVFASRIGELRFDTRGSLKTRTGITTVQATISKLDADLPSSATLPSVVDRGFYEGLVRPIASATTANGTEVSAEDATAKADFGSIAYDPDLSQATDDELAQASMDGALVMFKAERFGVRRVAYEIISAGSTAEDLLGLELRDRVRVKTTTPQGLSVDEECNVLGIQVAGDRDGRVTGSLTLITSDIYDDLGAADWFVWDEDNWDEENWTY